MFRARGQLLAVMYAIADPGYFSRSLRSNHIRTLVRILGQAANLPYQLHCPHSVHAGMRLGAQLGSILILPLHARVRRCSPADSIRRRLLRHLSGSPSKRACRYYARLDKQCRASGWPDSFRLFLYEGLAMVRPLAASPTRGSFDG